MPSPDETWLDDLLDRCVATLLAGHQVDLDALIAERPHLSADAAEVLELARRVAASRTEPALAHRRIAGLTIERELGRGATATVYLVRQSSLGRELALKVLSGAVAQSDHDRRRFLAEARALARLRHPHVVAVLDVIDTDGVLGYTMPWIRGATLAQRIEEHRNRAADAEPSAAPWSEFVCRAGVAVARALAAVHAAGMLHRDVKPSNVLIDSDGNVLLSDFGLVRDPDASLETRTGVFLGTLAYAAPEQVRGSPTDARADVYALGATLYHALTLQLPIQGRTPAELVAGIEQGAVTPLRRLAPDLPRDLEAVLGKAMAHRPEQRYTTAQEFADDLQRVLDSQPVRARAPAWWSRAIARARRQRRVVLAAIGGALLAVAAVAASAWVERRRDAQYARALAALAEVQLALLDPELRTRVQVAARGLDASPATLLRSVESALGRAEAAADLPLAPRRSAILRDLLRAARARLRSEVVPVSPLLEQLCPRTAHALRHPEADPGDATTDREDLQALGVAAYLTGQFARAVAALEQAEAQGDAPRDPFADGLLGQLHLALGRPERAYPRLLRVAEQLHASHLSAAAADAAVRCGDATVARRLVAHARGPRSPLALLSRIEADLDWLAGRGADALAAYDAGQAMGEDTYLRRTQYLESIGEWHRALIGYINLAGLSDDAEAMRGVLRTARAYWATLTPALRRTALLDELAGERAGPGSLFGALAVVHRARATLRRDPRAAAPAFTIEAAREGLATALANDPLDELAHRVVATAPDLARCTELPAEARARLVDAWLTAEDAREAARWLEEHGAKSRDGDALFFRNAPDLPPTWRKIAELPAPHLAAMTTYGSPLAECVDVDGDDHGDVLLHTQPTTGLHAELANVLICAGATGTVLHKVAGMTPLDKLGGALAAAGVPGRPVWAAGVINRDGEPGHVAVMRGDLAAWRTHRDIADLQRVQGKDAATAVFGHSLAWLRTPTAGTELLAVGAPGVDADGCQFGRVEVFAADGSRLWSTRGHAAYDSLGEYLARIGDLDGDGVDELAAGTLHRVGGDGYVAVMSGATGARLFEARPDDEDAGEGLRVAGVGDLDGDGTPDLAMAWQPHARRFGCAKVVSGRTRTTLLALRGTRPFDGFGADVTGVGDLDGDGRADLAVTAWSEASLTPPCVYLFDAHGHLLATAPGIWRLRRLAVPQLPKGRARFACIALGSWTRYADATLGGHASAAVWELDLTSAQRR